MNQINELPRDYDLEGACYPSEVLFRSPRTHGQGLVHKQRLQTLPVPPTAPQCGDTLVVDVISDPSSDDVDVGQTLRLSSAQLAQFQKQGTPNIRNDRLQDLVQWNISDQSNFLSLFLLCCCYVFAMSLRAKHVNIMTHPFLRSAGSCLTLEVINGPSRGLRCSVQSTNSSRLPLTLGRVSPSDLLIKDSEVSGKHAMIKWNLDVNSVCSRTCSWIFNMYGV